MIALCQNLETGYDDIGTGVPVVFVHGFPLNRSLWAPQAHGLVDRARCIAPDLRGFGESTVTPPYSMDQYADDVVSLMDVLRLDRAVIVGLSMGGYVAMAMWRRHKARVRALALVDTRAGADSPEGRGKRDDMIALAKERGSAAVADAMIGSMVGEGTKSRAPEVVESVHSMLSSAPVDGVIGALGALKQRPDSAATLATVDVPTLIVVGDEDALTPVAESQAMHQMIRGSSLETICGAGHLSNLERPAAFNHVMSEFLATLTLA
ncbi:MAG: alpha/beta fold hydrolase [Gemmatimonadaceae bacterium]